MEFIKNIGGSQSIILNKETGKLEIDENSGKCISGLRLIYIDKQTFDPLEFSGIEKITVAFINEDDPDEGIFNFSAGTHTNRLHYLLLQLCGLKTFGNLSLYVHKKKDIVNVIIIQKDKSESLGGAFYSPPSERTDNNIQGLVNTINARIEQEFKLNSHPSDE